MIQMKHKGVSKFVLPLERLKFSQNLSCGLYSHIRFIHSLFTYCLLMSHIVPEKLSLIYWQDYSTLKQYYFAFKGVGNPTDYFN